MKGEKLINSSQVLGTVDLKDPQLVSMQIHKKNGNLVGILYVEFSNDGVNFIRNPDADTAFVALDTDVMLEIVDTCAAVARFGIDVTSGSSDVQYNAFTKGDEE